MDLTFNGLDPKQEYNMINPNRGCDRDGNYKYRNQILEKWSYTSESIGRCIGNVKAETYFRVDTNQVVFADHSESSFDIWRADSPYKRFGSVISSAMLMYRLCCLFRGAPDVLGEDAYKTIWSYTLKHESGKILMFSEWKGCAGFWLSDHTYKELSDDFREDLRSLILFIFSDQIPHPYDSCTAGETALLR